MAARSDYDFRQLVFVRIADHVTNPGKRCNFVGRPLRVASRDDDLAARILAMNAADGCPRILISRSGDSARVQYNDFRLRGGVATLQTALLELARDSSTIGLCSPASKVLDVVACH